MRNATRSILFLAGTTVLVSALAAGLRGTENGASESEPATVRGEYIEARTCDVWTGPCFANSEINMAGDNAILGWIVDRGAWDGVRLDGLRIVAALDAEGTLGTDAEGPVKSVVFVDARADASQGKALLAMARSLAPTYLRKVVDVRREKIVYRREGDTASLKIGSHGKVGVTTKALNAHCDTICGNEEKAYPSLGNTLFADCAKTVAHRFQVDGLGVKWSDPGTRSAMLGRFEATSEPLAASSR